MHVLQGLPLGQEEDGPSATTGKSAKPSALPAVVPDAIVDPEDADSLANMPLAKRKKTMEPSASV